MTEIATSPVRKTQRPTQLLEIQTGKYKGQRVQLTGRSTVIGRGELARIRIPSTDVSREHCKLTFEGSRIVVEDLKSMNGTFINGRPIHGPRYLGPGYTLTVGPVTFKLLGEEVDSKAKSVTDPKIDLTGSRTPEPIKYSEDQISNWISPERTPAGNSYGLETLSAIPKSDFSSETESDLPTVRPIAE